MTWRDFSGMSDLEKPILREWVEIAVSYSINHKRNHKKTWLVHRCVGLPRFRRAKFHKFHSRYLQGERNQDLLLSWLSRQKHKSLVRWIDLLCNCSVHFKMLFLCWSSLAGQMISFFYAAVIYFLRQCQHLMKFTKRKIMMASFYWICSMVHKTATALQTFTDKL